MGKVTKLDFEFAERLPKAERITMLEKFISDCEAELNLAKDLLAKSRKS
jgi:hypothetical protein